MSAVLMVIDAMDRDLRERCDARREREQAAAERARVAAKLLADVAAGIRVLRDRDGSNVTEGQAQERANNIVAGIIGNFHVVERP